MKEATKKRIMKLMFFLLLFAAGTATQAQENLKILFGKKVIHSSTLSKSDAPASCMVTSKTMSAVFSTVTVNFALQQYNAVYKNTLQLVCTAADGSEKNMDAPLTKGTAVFAAAGVKKMLRMYKSIKLQLVQNPANPQMSIPTRIRELLLINTK
jgi:hypothetical protein